MTEGDGDVLRAEIETLRNEGLHLMETCEAERRESKRLHAIAVRHQTKAEDLERDLAALAAEHGKALELIRVLDDTIARSNARVTALEEGLRQYARHDDKCPAGRSPGGNPCTCGLAQLTGNATTGA